MKKPQQLLILSSLALFGMVAVAFGQSAHSSAARATVTTHLTSLGTILVDGAGHTLYLNTGDKPGHFPCTGGCAAAWPVLATSGPAKAAGKAKASALGTVKRGKVTQVTYAGHPLYTFVSDSKATPTSGEGVSGFFVVSPSGAKVTKSTKTTTTTTSSSSSSASNYHY